jgi:hypothetical protein
MKRLLLAPIALLLLSACASDPELMSLPPPDGMQPPPMSSPLPNQHALKENGIDIHELQAQLGLNRGPQELGFADKNFDGCSMSYKGKDGTCGFRYLSVVHFRLVCRDTVETTTRAPSSLTPLMKNNMQWRLAGIRGDTSTDSQGYGQVQVVSMRPVKTERFILIIGTKTLGLEAGEVSQIVLPGNWCPRVAMN